MDKLKPCPFCGGEVKMEPVSFSEYAGNYYDNEYSRIRCEPCGFDMRIYPKGLGCTQEEKEELAERWNRRACE